MSATWVRNTLAKPEIVFNTFWKKDRNLIFFCSNLVDIGLSRLLAYCQRED